jgi:hypothetical protein
MNDVVNSGDICSLCADPFAQPDSVHTSDGYTATDSANVYSGGSKKRGILLNGGGSVNTGAIIPTSDHSSTSANSGSQSNVQVYHHGQAPSVATTAPPPVVAPVSAVTAKTGNSAPVTSGITKNVNTDKIERAFLFKWFRSAFTSIPFTFDNDVTAFQVFPDYSGQSLNQSGYACDQVMIYGQVPLGFISENNDVEVYGRRDSKGNIIASAIKNTASGTTVKAHWSFSAAVVKVITLSLLAAIIVLVMAVSGSASIQAVMGQVASVVAIIAVIAFLVTHPRALSAVLTMVLGLAKMIVNIIGGIIKAIFGVR